MFHSTEWIFVDDVWKPELIHLIPMRFGEWKTVFIQRSKLLEKVYFLGLRRNDHRRLFLLDLLQKDNSRNCEVLESFFDHWSYKENYCLNFTPYCLSLVHTSHMLQRLFLQIIGIFSIFTATDCNRLQQLLVIADWQLVWTSLYTLKIVKQPNKLL